MHPCRCLQFLPASMVVALLHVRLHHQQAIPSHHLPSPVAHSQPTFASCRLIVLIMRVIVKALMMIAITLALTCLRVAVENHPRWWCSFMCCGLQAVFSSSSSPVVSVASYSSHPPPPLFAPPAPSDKASALESACDAKGLLLGLQCVANPVGMGFL